MAPTALTAVPVSNPPDARVSADDGVRAAGGAAGLTYAEEILTDNPALYWRLGEPSGTNANDETANNRDGTYTATGVALGAAGLLVGDADTSVDFSGGAITCGYNPFVNGTQRTFEGWAFRDVVTGAQTLLASNGANAPRLFALNNSQAMWFEPDSSAGAARMEWNSNPIPTAVTFHWALTYDETTNVAELFIDGASQGTRTTVSAWGASPGTFQVARRFTSTEPWNGRLDEIAVYESILSGTRIAAHHAAGT